MCAPAPKIISKTSNPTRQCVPACKIDKNHICLYLYEISGKNVSENRHNSVIFNRNIVFFDAEDTDSCVAPQQTLQCAPVCVRICSRAFIVSNTNSS